MSNDKELYYDFSLAIICNKMHKAGNKDYQGTCIYASRCTQYNPNREKCKSQATRHKTREKKNPVESDDSISLRLEKQGIQEELRTVWYRLKGEIE